MLGRREGLEAEKDGGARAAELDDLGRYAGAGEQDEAGSRYTLVLVSFTALAVQPRRTGSAQ